MSENSIVKTSGADILASAQTTFFPLLRIAQSTFKNIGTNNILPGHWLLDGTTSLGPTIQVIPLAWRLAARIFDDNKLIEQSYNIGEGAKYDIANSNWYFPYGHTAKFIEIQRDKRSIIGADVLFAEKTSARLMVYFLAKTALQNTDVWNICRAKTGFVLDLGTKQVENKKEQRWFVPNIGKVYDTPPVQITEDLIATFIHPNEDAESNADSVDSNER